MDKHCTNCGNKVNEDAVVCIHCGCKITKSESNKPTFQQRPYAATILGIIGIIFSWIFALAGHITSIIGIVIGIKEYKKNMYSIGLLLSIIGEICSVVSSIVGAIIMSSLF